MTIKQLSRQFRQGDVLFEQVPAIPGHAVELPCEDAVVVIARGEATGHAHVFRNDGRAALLEDGGDRYLRVMDMTPVTHEEHTTIHLPPSLYRIVYQREYEPGGWHAVAD